MAQSNHERVGRALELLNKGLQPFIEREMQAVYGDRWLQEAAANLRDHQLASARSGELSGDTQVLLMVMWDQWYNVFRNVLGQTERSLVSELREVRNKWAHQEAFSTDNAYRTLDSVQLLLTSVSAAQLASEVERPAWSPPKHAKTVHFRSFPFILLVSRKMLPRAGTQTNRPTL